MSSNGSGVPVGFDASVAGERRRIEARCAELVARMLDGAPNVREAVEYALLGGGKRLRPLLCLWTHEACGGRNDTACLDTACAVECLHTYSLVHDDLPCMDDDDMRRGRASCHKRFGEAIAVLAGDALLTLCFEILTTVSPRAPLDAEAVGEVSRIIAAAAGGGGLIGGQALDLSGEHLEDSLETVERIHRGKTAALIGAAMESGAVLAGVDAVRRGRVREAGLLAGLAFQIVDDLLDLSADGETLGKTPGKDARDGKLTYPAIAGVEAAAARANELISQARALLEGESGAGRLVALLDSMVRRSN
ncbi:MAG: polyprenyl synthetase family protein [Candidatus Krumholzibacteriia bacterium]